MADVDALLEHLPATLFSEWQAYYQIEPWGEDQADLRAGIIASTIANAHRDVKRKPDQFTPQDFMPKFEPKRRKKLQTWQEQLNIARLITLALGGTDGTEIHGRD